MIKRKRMKREDYLKLRRSMDVLSLGMILMYGMIIISDTTPIWVIARPFVAISLIAVVLSGVLTLRARRLGGIVLLGVGLVQTLVLMAIVMNQGMALWIAVITALLYTAPILALGAAQINLANRQPPTHADSDHEQHDDHTRLAVSDAMAATDSPYAEGESERRARRVQWHQARAVG